MMAYPGLRAHCVRPRPSPDASPPSSGSYSPIASTTPISTVVCTKQAAIASADFSSTLRAASDAGTAREPRSASSSGRVLKLNMSAAVIALPIHSSTSVT